MPIIDGVVLRAAATFLCLVSNELGLIYACNPIPVPYLCAYVYALISLYILKVYGNPNNNLKSMLAILLLDHPFKVLEEALKRTHTKSVRNNNKVLNISTVSSTFKRMVV